jgi:hypothetical protein
VVVENMKDDKTVSVETGSGAQKRIRCHSETIPTNILFKENIKWQ